MDIQRFMEQFPHIAQDGTPFSDSLDTPPLEARFQQAKGVADRALLPWLDRAVDCMAVGEVYCEVGCAQGMNLIAALLNHPECMAYAVEDPDRPGYRDEWLCQLTQNLETFGLEDRVLVCGQPFEAFFNELNQAGLADRIGVYVYNGDADYRSILVGLMLATPLLADQALIVVSQAYSRFAQQAVSDFLVAYPQATAVTGLVAENQPPPTHPANCFVLCWDTKNTPANGVFDWQAYRDRTVIESLYNLPATPQTPDLGALRQAAVQLHVEGRLTEAEQQYRRILQFEPQNAEIWLNLGMLYYLAENDSAAIAALRQSLALNATSALPYQILGLALERTNCLSEARAAYEQAIAINPHYTDALNQLGTLYLQAHELEQAETLFRQAMAANPNEFAGYLHLGDVLVAQDRLSPAIDAYHQALVRKRRDPNILQKLGTTCKAAGDLASGHNYLAFACYRRGDHAAAITEFQEFLAQNPVARVTDYLSLYDCYLNCGQVQAAIECLQAVAQLRPDDHFFAISHQLVLPMLYDTAAEISRYRQQVMDAFEALEHRVMTATARSTPIDLSGIEYFTNFYLSFQGLNDRDIQSAYGHLMHYQMGKHHADWQLPRSMPPIGTGKIRIGYLADNIGNNSATRWAIGWLKNHDRSKFEIYCYNIGAVSDQRTEQFKTLCDQYHHIPDDLAATATQIIADDLHILVFLAIGTWAPTAQIASLRLAPVQCSAWGHPVTSGLPTVDYFLSGDLMEPDNAQDHYTEQLIRLPNIGISYPQPLIAEPTYTRAEFGLREDAVVYLSCQLLFKYLPQHDDLFPEIARRVPNAQIVFVLRSSITQRSNIHLERQFRQRLERAFTAAGLDMNDHCIFLPGQDWNHYTSLLSVASAFLDTLSFSGGHTTFDAIACRLPVVTCPGDLMRGRQSYGALKMLGVTDTIAQTEAEYIEIAVRLGLEPDWQQAIAQRMGERLHYLFDDQTCVAGLEQFYQQAVAAKATQPGSNPQTAPIMRI